MLVSVKAMNATDDTEDIMANWSRNWCKLYIESTKWASCSWMMRGAAYVILANSYETKGVFELNGLTPGERLSCVCRVAPSEQRQFTKMVKALLVDGFLLVRNGCVCIYNWPSAQSKQDIARDGIDRSMSRDAGVTDRDMSRETGVTSRDIEPMSRDIDVTDRDMSHEERDMSRETGVTNRDISVTCHAMSRVTERDMSQIVTRVPMTAAERKRKERARKKALLADGPNPKCHGTNRALREDLEIEKEKEREREDPVTSRDMSRSVTPSDVTPMTGMDIRPSPERADPPKPSQPQPGPTPPVADADSLPSDGPRRDFSAEAFRRGVEEDLKARKAAREAEPKNRAAMQAELDVYRVEDPIDYCIEDQGYYDEKLNGVEGSCWGQLSRVRAFRSAGMKQKVREFSDAFIRSVFFKTFKDGLATIHIEAAVNSLRHEMVQTANMGDASKLMTPMSMLAHVRSEAYNSLNADPAGTKFLARKS